MEMARAVLPLNGHQRARRPAQQQGEDPPCRQAGDQGRDQHVDDVHLGRARAGLDRQLDAEQPDDRPDDQPGGHARGPTARLLRVGACIVFLPWIDR